MFDDEEKERLSQIANVPGELLTQSPVRVFEMVIDHLENALSPRVGFVEDFNKMRINAEAERISEIENALRVLVNNVPGLRIREKLINRLKAE